MSVSETTLVTPPVVVTTSSVETETPRTPLTASTISPPPAQRPMSQNVRNNTNEDNTSSSVMVAIRIRPLLALEAGSDRCITVLHTRSGGGGLATTPLMSSSSLRLGGSSGPRFTFDRVHDSETRQDAVFEHSCLPLVQSCLQGYNATVLAYGQTGSGKTYTMVGENVSASAMTRTAGVIPRALHHLFDALEQQKTQNQSMDYQVRVQFLELYGEEIHDLLRSSSSQRRCPPTPASSFMSHQSSSNDLLSTASSSSPSRQAQNNTNTADRLTIRDVGQHDGEPEVVGATLQPVESATEALDCLEMGLLRRVTAATAMNESSSRSHAILSVIVEQTTTTTTTSADSNSEEHVQVKRSKFNFVDLAGSERVKKTHAQGKRLKEGIDINKGLLVLGNVISALGDPKKRGKAFVPYRDSKLTRLLKGSLGGNHKTLMIACVSPSENNMDESLNCLRYANRAKNIQNNAVVNVDANSRRITELQGQVSALATALLHNVYGTEHEKGQQPPPVVFTKEILEALAKGDETTNNGPAAAAVLSPPTPRSGDAAGSSSAGGGGGSPGRNGRPSATPRTKARIEHMEREINETQELLRLSQSNHDVAEEQLYVAKAEKELLQLQLSVLSDSHADGGAGGLMNESVASFALDGDETGKAFVAKATEYEKEIGKLREALRQAETKLERMAWLSSTNSSEDDQASLALKRAEDQLNLDRERMNQLKSIIEEDDHAVGDDDDDDDEDEEEDHAEEQKVKEITSKYLAAGGYEDEDDKEAPDSDAKSDDGLSAIAVSTTSHEHAQADLMELSRNIAAKEELIDQLKLSQEKYASMRGFYEDRMNQMEQALNERESERQALLRELDEAKKSDSSSRELQDRLEEKEKHIANLRKKHRQLVDLTAVSSRNSSEIARLQNDVKEMKRRKVDLQKELNRERKDHAAEIKKLQKEAIQKEKELNRWKAVSSKREIEARTANHIAKTRLEELGQLRTKYKDSEKQLRLLSVKRGVMAKAGLDPVIVGRRNGQRPTKHSRTSKGSNMNADSLRGYFDEKVADVVRKEALADKLAHEWEEHFELMTKMDQVKRDKPEDVEDAVQSLSLQIQFKEDRIRRLANRLGKQKGSAKENKAGVFDEQFAKICGEGPGSEASRDSVAKVLFGMVVRERRRVTSLARTASSLDERLQSAEKAANVSEAALRSYMDEQSEEFVALSQAQQEHILSLMGMVKDESERGFDDMDDVAAADSTMLVLANERILVLEQEVNDLRSRLDTQKSYRSKAEDLESALESKTQECREVLEELSELRATMRQVREEATTGQDDGEHATTIVEIVDDALHLCGEHGSKKVQARRRRSHPGGKQDVARQVLSPRIKKHIELMHSSDSDAGGDDGEDSSWKEMTDDIMSDLALIADGKMPPSLENKGFPGEASSLESGSVFDRLADPQSFTGTQKQVLSAKGDAGGVVGSSKRGQDDRKAMSKEIASCLDKIVIPGEDGSSFNHIPKEASVDRGKQTGGPAKPGYKSVFERLVSPSNYTGTQKERLQGHRAKKETRSDDSASRLQNDAPKDKSQDRRTKRERLPDDSASRSSLNRVPEKDKDSSGYGTDRSESASGSHYSDYAQPNVFERLQKTTTQAYAMKHTGTHSPETTSSDPLTSPRQPNNEPKPTVSTREEPRTGNSSYTKQDVFVRLQKTTTEAYAKKTSRQQRGKSS